MPTVVCNAWVTNATDIRRCRQDGRPLKNAGSRIQGPDDLFWAAREDINRGDFLLHFKVTVPKPGEYEAILTLDSEAYSGPPDIRYSHSFEARSGPRG